MNPLEQKILEKIKREGPITFETYMDMALYEPGLGYYASDSTEIGRAGDFYTSQHLHPAFGALIGKQIEEMWEVMGMPSDFHIVEPGAGAGLMCMDIMNYLCERRIFQSLAYVIVEKNPSVQDRQNKLLEKYMDRIQWTSSVGALVNIKGCVLSNELLDAFPVHVIEMEEGLKEVYVTAEGYNLREIKGPISTDALKDYLNGFSIILPEGYKTEINLGIKDWIKTVSGVLREGFILTIDYGYPALDYYSDERNRGTLLCYYHHQVNENPYINVGNQDITSHVNFSSVRKWGEESGFRTLGFCQQGVFLISLGIDEIMQGLYENAKDYLFEVAKIKRLIFPGTLGETHKVMIQYKGKGDPKLRGFSMKNQKDRLK